MWLAANRPFHADYPFSNNCRQENKWSQSDPLHNWRRLHALISLLRLHAL